MESLNIKEQPKRQRFEPYVFHGGTGVGVDGKDYAIIAADTRLSNGGYSIQTRKSTKLCKLTSKVVLATVGCQCDCLELHKVLKYRLECYKQQHGKEMKLKAVSQLLMNILYSRRAFPYFSFCLLGGVDEFGKGCLYGYDAIGSKGKVDSGALGSGRSLIQPLLDSQRSFSNQLIIPKDLKKDGLSLDNALSLVKDSFLSATERDIYTGDYVEIYVITNKGVKREVLELKKD